jgi:hypothetical protein
MRYPHSSAAYAWRFASLMGWGFEARKALIWDERPTFLGCVTDYTSIHTTGMVTITAKSSTQAKLLAAIDACLERGAMSSADAASIRGLAQFVRCGSRIGQAATQPLTDRQRDKRSRALTPQLRGALEFLRVVHADPKPLRFPVRPPPPERPVLVFTDASFSPTGPDKHGQGHLGIVWMFPPGDDEDDDYEVFYAQQPAPADVLAFSFEMKAKHQFVNVLELYTSVAAYFSEHVSAQMRDRPIIHFGDNLSANAVLVNGYSTVGDMARIASAAHVRFYRLRCRPWTVYVASDANPADEPSRPELWTEQDGELGPPRLRAMGATEIPFPDTPYREWCRPGDWGEVRPTA